MSFRYTDSSILKTQEVYSFKLWSQWCICISASPEEPPHIRINDYDFTGDSPSNMVTVIEGLETTLGCDVHGGDSPEATTSLVCGGVRVPWTSFIFTRHQDGKTCTCSADHFTGCYEKTTSVQLQIACESVLVNIKQIFIICQVVLGFHLEIFNTKLNISRYFRTYP